MKYQIFFWKKNNQTKKNKKKKKKKKKLTMVHIVIHNVEAFVQRCSIKEVVLEIS